MKKNHLTYWLFFFFLTFLCILILKESFYKPLAQDEGVFLTITQEILKGQTPYLDFFDHKPPGIYFILLPVIFLFGKNILAIKIFLFFTNLVSAYLVFLIANQFKKGAGLFASVIFLFVLMFYEGNYIIAEPFMTAFILGSFYFLNDFLKHGNNKKIWISGFLSGVAMLIKQVAVVNFFILGIFFLLKTKKIKNFSIFLFSAFIIWIPIILWLYAKGAFNDALDQIIILNFTSYPSEPFLKVISSFFETFIKTFPIWFFSLIYFLNVKKNKNILPVIFLIFLPIPLFFVRHYSHYWIQIIPFVAVLASLGADLFFNNKNHFINKKVIKYFFLIIIIFNMIGNYKLFSWYTNKVNTPKIRDQKEAVKFINNNKGKKILTENQFTGFYFLTEKKNINKYLYITEINEDEGPEEKTITDLKNSPDTIIVWPKDLNFAYAKKLQEFIIGNYKPVKEYSNIGLVIYIRN